MKTLIRQYKSELKQQAKDIRAMKDQRKKVPNGYVSGLFQARYNFRVKHVAYCLIRGRTLEQIEGPHPGIKRLNDGRAWKEVERLMAGTKMYILVRKDLSKSQQAVQACHAVAKYLVENAPKDRIETWDYTKVLLAVEDLKELKDWLFTMSREKVEYGYFREGREGTALACFLQGDERELVKNLPLL